jgi:hypothetical protein
MCTTAIAENAERGLRAGKRRRAVSGPPWSPHRRVESPDASGSEKANSFSVQRRVNIGFHKRSNGASHFGRLPAALSLSGRHYPSPRAGQSAGRWALVAGRRALNLKRDDDPLGRPSGRPFCFLRATMEPTLAGMRFVVEKAFPPLGPATAGLFLSGRARPARPTR